MEEIGAILGILAFLTLIYLYFASFATMASARNRSPGFWLLMGLFFGPIIWLVLWVASPVDEGEEQEMRGKG